MNKITIAEHTSFIQSVLDWVSSAKSSLGYPHQEYLSSIHLPMTDEDRIALKESQRKTLMPKLAAARAWKGGLHDLLYVMGDYYSAEKIAEFYKDENVEKINTVLSLSQQVEWARRGLVLFIEDSEELMKCRGWVVKKEDGEDGLRLAASMPIPESVFFPVIKKIQNASLSGAFMPGEPHSALTQTARRRLHEETLKEFITENLPAASDSLLLSVKHEGADDIVKQLMGSKN